MALFPVFLRLEGRRCVVVGAGKLAEPKIAGVLRAGARVLVVAPSATRRIAQWSREHTIRWTRRKFHAPDLARAFLVIAATGLADVNACVFHAARRRNIPCNAVDDPAHCDFFYPAVLRRGPFQIAISTGGASPALARRLRQEFDRLFSAQFGEWVEHLVEARKKIFAQNLPLARRRQILRRIATPSQFRAFLENPVQSVRAKVQ